MPLDMGCYMVGAARYFIGKDNSIVEVLAWGNRLMHHDRTDAEDNAVLLMHFEGGRLAIAETRWRAQSWLNLRNAVYDTIGAIFTNAARETGIRVFALKGAGYSVEKGELDIG